MKLKRTVLIGLSIVTLLGACSDPQYEDNSEESEETEVFDLEEEAVPAERPEERAESTAAVESVGEKNVETNLKTEESNDLNWDPETMRDFLQNALDGLAEVTLREGDTFLIHPTEPGFAMELTQIINGEISLQPWNVLLDNLAQISETLGESYSIALVNPVNTENLIAVVSDGSVIYDALNE